MTIRNKRLTQVRKDLTDTDVNNIIAALDMYLAIAKNNPEAIIANVPRHTRRAQDYTEFMVDMVKMTLENITGVEQE